MQCKIDGSKDRHSGLTSWPRWRCCARRALVLAAAQAKRKTQVSPVAHPARAEVAARVVPALPLRLAARVEPEAWPPAVPAQPEAWPPAASTQPVVRPPAAPVQPVVPPPAAPARQVAPPPAVSARQAAPRPAVPAPQAVPRPAVPAPQAVPPPAAPARQVVPPAAGSAQVVPKLEVQPQGAARAGLQVRAPKVEPPATAEALAPPAARRPAQVECYR